MQFFGSFLITLLGFQLAQGAVLRRGYGNGPTDVSNDYDSGDGAADGYTGEGNGYNGSDSNYNGDLGSGGNGDYNPEDGAGEKNYGGEDSYGSDDNSHYINGYGSDHRNCMDVDVNIGRGKGVNVNAKYNCKVLGKIKQKIRVQRGKFGRGGYSGKKGVHANVDVSVGKHSSNGY